MGFHQPFKNRSLFASGPRYWKHQRIKLTYAISRQNRMSKEKTNLKFVEDLILTLSVALRRVSALNVTYKLYIIRSDIHLAVLIYSSSFWRDGGNTNTHTHAHTHTHTHSRTHTQFKLISHIIVFGKQTTKTYIHTPTYQMSCLGLRTNITQRRDLLLLLFFCFCFFVLFLFCCLCETRFSQYYNCKIDI